MLHIFSHLLHEEGTAYYHTETKCWEKQTEKGLLSDALPFLEEEVAFLKQP